ncbi:MAG: phosphopantetheine-binding protein [Caldilineaceae bacterium]
MTRTEIFDVIKKHMFAIIEDLDETVQIEEADSMRDLGADSIDVAEIVTDSLQELRLKVDRTSLKQVTNLAELLDVLEKAAQQTATNAAVTA